MSDPGAGDEPTGGPSEQPDKQQTTPPETPAAAVQVLAAAREEAERLQSGAIGAEHLLLTTLAQAETSTALAELGLDGGALRQRLEASARKGRPRSEAEATEPLGVTSHARRLLEAAEKESRNRGASEVSLLHVATAAFGDPRGVLARTFADAGISGKKARIAMERAQGLAPPATSPAASTDPSASQPAAAEEPRPPRERRERTRGKRQDATPSEQPRKQQPAQRSERRTRERPEEKPAPRAPEQKESGSGQPPGELKPRQPLKHLRRQPSFWGPLWRKLLLLAVPAALVANWMHQSPVVIFVLACLAVLPLAGFMGDATEHLSARTGPTIGGLLNATFGNAAELIIALVALRAGMVELVKASITGSILGNLLLIMGLSILLGGINRSELRFNRTTAGMSAGMLVAAVVGLVFPALFHATHPNPSALTELRISEGVSVVLIILYFGSLLFTLRTHRWLLGGDPHDMPGPIWGVPRAVTVLAAATVGVAVMSEILVHAVEAVTEQVGLTPTFLGLIVIPLIGNAAEHATAVVVARKGKMDLALQIAYGSSTQIALLVAPVLVFAGLLFGQDMNLVFTPFEVMAVFLATIVASMGTSDGESHWFEGLMLLGVYAMIAISAFFI
ncbi:MAG TPA: calcium/proton exchanger [Gemmatimonadales bacterium]|nr:calcium/proton exchanger [Gemmatimonadales bacterium]